MIKIKFFSDFCNNSNCKKMIELCCNASSLDFYGRDKSIYIVNNDDNDYTHAIIINKAMPLLNIPKQNVIGLAYEPYDFLKINQEFIEYAEKYIGKYFIGDKKNLPEPFVEYFGYMWFIRPPKTITMPAKKKIMSIILSAKKFAAPGHKYRHELVKSIIKYNLPIDIFGRGSNEYKSLSKHIKGEFIHAEPYEEYLYTISIENFMSKHYFSEKIINPIMYNCSPIYNGCLNIDKYFENVILLSGHLEYDILLLKQIFHNPLKYYKNMFNEKNEKTVNLLKNVEKLYL